jgi:hypothetical protein
MLRVILRPFRDSGAARYRLDMFDSHETDRDGKYRVCYVFSRLVKGKRAEVLFTGDDYCPGRGTAIDSIESARGLLGFLTLRPGDTDSEYFERYSDAQRAFAATDAEAVACEVEGRFGEER